MSDAFEKIRQDAPQDEVDDSVVGLNSVVPEKKNKKFFLYAMIGMGLLLVVFVATFIKAQTTPARPTGPTGAVNPMTPQTQLPAGLSQPPMPPMDLQGGNQPMASMPVPQGQPQAGLIGPNAQQQQPQAQPPVDVVTIQPITAAPAAKPENAAPAPAPAPQSAGGNAQELEGLRIRVTQLENENMALREKLSAKESAKAEKAEKVAKVAPVKKEVPAKAPQKVATPTKTNTVKPAFTHERPTKAIGRLEDTPTSKTATQQASREENSMQPAPVAQTWSLRGISNGLAWIADNQGKLVSVTVGEHVSGLGQVTQIDDDNKSVRIGRTVLK